MEIIDKNISEQTRKIIRLDGGGNEWVDIPNEIGSKQVLTDSQILELSEMICNIEKHYGFPCDIEWAYEGGKFYITQSRPITTLQNKSTTILDNEELKDSDLVEVDADNGAVKVLNQVNDEDSLLRIDWEKSLERKQSFLIASIISNAYKSELYNISGIRFENELVSYKNGYATYFRSTKEMEQVLSGQFLELAVDSKKIKNIIKKGLTTPKQANDLILSVQKSLSEGGIGNITEIIQEYKEIFTYQTILPYWILRAIDSVEGKEREKYAQVVELFAPFRMMSDSKQLEESVLLPLVTFLSEKKGLDKELLLYLSESELVLMVTGESDKNLDSFLKKRSTNDFVYHLDKNAIDRFEYDQSYTSLGEETFVSDAKTVWEGSSAYPGKVVGVAKVIESPKDMVKFNKGDIVISVSTSPVLTPMLSNARAIVSDEGGIMTHAAIISREMKIPAVVGVGDASKFIKDGDLVEVDADKGLVKIITKA